MSDVLFFSDSCTPRQSCTAGGWSLSLSSAHRLAALLFLLGVVGLLADLAKHFCFVQVTRNRDDKLVHYFSVY